jgi:hypothetical protein
MLIVTGGATDNILVSVADVKDAMDITDAGHDETLLRFIRRASRRIETYVGRPLLDQVYRATLPSYGGRVLQLPCHPIRSVLRIFDGTDTGTGTELSSTDYTVDYETGHLHRDSWWPWTYVALTEVAPFPAPNQEYPRWLVEFSAGYIPPMGKDTGSTGDGTTTTGTTIPFDIQDAAISLTRSMWLSRARESGIKSKHVGELSITYGTPTNASMPDEVAAMLAPYRSII